MNSILGVFDLEGLSHGFRSVFITAKGEGSVQLAVFSFQSLDDETIARFSMLVNWLAVSSVWPIDY